MNILPTSVDGVVIIEPRVFVDERGSFFESWERSRYEAAGLPGEWIQDNVVHSGRGVLRGLHFQHPNGQHKLVSVLAGEVFDVAVDVRPDSASFGRWVGVVLSAENKRQLSVPPGFAHGYLALSETVVFSYKCSARYDPGAELCLRWNDPAIGIDWPMEPVLIARRDAEAPLLSEIPLDRLPRL